MHTKLTEEAATAIERALSRSDLSEGAGLRVWMRSVGGEPMLVTGLVEGPTPVDVRLPEEDGLLFVDPAAVDLLEGKVIDLERNGERVALVVMEPEDPY